MINFDDFIEENIQEHTNWHQIRDHLNKTLITGGSGSRKTNALLNLVSQLPDIDNYTCTQKIHLKENINC